MAKKKLAVVVSPEATAAYAWLSRPDEGQQYSDGKYKVTLVLPKNGKGVEEFIEDLQQKAEDTIVKEFGKLPRNYRTPFKDGDDTTKEEFQGSWLITVKSKYQPGFVDQTGKALDDDVFPMSGDIIKASFALLAYNAGGGIGAAGQLRNVMVVEKRNGGSAASDFGITPSAEQEELEDEDFDL